MLNLKWNGMSLSLNKYNKNRKLLTRQNWLLKLEKSKRKQLFNINRDKLWIILKRKWRYSKKELKKCQWLKIGLLKYKKLYKFNNQIISCKIVYYQLLTM